MIKITEITKKYHEILGFSPLMLEVMDLKQLSAHIVENTIKEGIVDLFIKVPESDRTLFNQQIVDCNKDVNLLLEVIFNKFPQEQIKQSLKIGLIKYLTSWFNLSRVNNSNVTEESFNGLIAEINLNDIDFQVEEILESIGVKMPSQN